MYRILFFILMSVCLQCRAQDAFNILFSRTGDTLMTRTSCYSRSKDTLDTWYNVLKNVNGDLQLVSVFIAREAGGKQCADLNAIPHDTIRKYGFVNKGYFGLMPKRFRVKPKVLQTDTIRSDKGELFYYKQVKYAFKIGRKTFYKSTIWQTYGTKDEPLNYPRLKNVYGNKELNKYHFVFIITSAQYSKESGKIKTTVAHTRVIN